MQRLWYSFLRLYVRVGLHFYFKRIIIHGRDNIPDGPVIFAANHQNAFLDALLIVCFTTPVTHFLTRADIFKRPLVRWVIGTLNMIPIYRMRDGWQSLVENQKTFDTCTELFIKNEAVVIFPEGNHHGQRRIRLLTKGFARLALEAMKKYPDLKISIVPVGLNYSAHQAFGSSVSVYFGPPIFVHDHGQGPAQITSLRDELAARLKRLTTHIADADRYNEIINTLELSQPNYLDPIDTNERIDIIERGEVVRTTSSQPAGQSLALLPLYFIARALNFIPILIWQIIKTKIKDPVFYSSIRFGVGIFLFPLYYLLIGTILYNVWGPLIGLGWCALAFASPFVLSRAT